MPQVRGVGVFMNMGAPLRARSAQRAGVHEGPEARSAGVPAEWSAKGGRAEGALEPVRKDLTVPGVWLCPVPGDARQPSVN